MRRSLIALALFSACFLPMIAGCGDNTQATQPADVTADLTEGEQNTFKQSRLEGQSLDSQPLTVLTKTLIQNNSDQWRKNGWELGDRWEMVLTSPTVPHIRWMLRDADPDAHRFMKFLPGDVVRVRFQDSSNAQCFMDGENLSFRFLTVSDVQPRPQDHPKKEGDR